MGRIDKRPEMARKSWWTRPVTVETGTIRTTCCIAGGGPAGIVAGYLLARAGVPVVVLEKHADFLRDFRGDTLHPSTLEVMHELGLLERLLLRHHDELPHLEGMIDDLKVRIADFSHLPTTCKFIALMPQWDFLDFLAEEGRKLPTFTLRMENEVTGLLTEGGKVVGVTARTPEGPVEIIADLVIGADGRHSAVRTAAHLEVRDFGVPIDVLWLRLSRQPDDEDFPLGRVKRDHLMITLNRGDYWQCAFVIPKGGFDKIKARGLPAFRDGIAQTAPALAERVEEISSWDDIKLLTVSVDRLRKWARPGLLCIGDSAHAMSPIGGVGINLAIQDAVAAANILAGPLSDGGATLSVLEKLQQRRWFPTAATQRLQVFLHNHFLNPVLAGHTPAGVRVVLKMLQTFPILTRIPARVVGLGVRPEHVRTRAATVPKA